MGDSIELTFENRIQLERDSGYLIHVFGEGYSIIDEKGREMNTFADEIEFNRLIKKFCFRHYLMQKLEKKFGCHVSFRQDNVLFIHNKPIEGVYWNLPKNDNDVERYLEYISNKYQMDAGESKGDAMKIEKLPGITRSTKKTTRKSRFGPL